MSVVGAAEPFRPRAVILRRSSSPFLRRLAKRSAQAVGAGIVVPKTSIASVSLAGATNFATVALITRCDQDGGPSGALLVAVWPLLAHLPCFGTLSSFPQRVPHTISSRLLGSSA